MVLVVGMARSGIAAARLLQSHGRSVFVTDSGQPAGAAELDAAGIPYETGHHTRLMFLDAEEIVVSPGVPVDAQPLTQARALGQAVIGEIELAAEFLQGNIVAITGSNGKTTTTTLTGEILAEGGLNTLVGGNIGTPAISFVEQSTPETTTVLEVSSFQLETIRTFRP